MRLAFFRRVAILKPSPIGDRVKPAFLGKSSLLRLVFFRRVDPFHRKTQFLKPFPIGDRVKPAFLGKSPLLRLVFFRRDAILNPLLLVIE